MGNPQAGEQQTESPNYVEHIPQPAQSARNAQGSSMAKRIMMGAGVLALTMAAIVGIFVANVSGRQTVDHTPEAIEALDTHVSTELGIGTLLLEDDEVYVGQDLTIVHQSQEDITKIWVWDYAAEDGDYVQILVDGTPIGEPFMIRNKPVTYTVPSVGEVQVVGTRDGGGGITYGVYYEVDQTTYFNGMDEGGMNTYTLIRE